MAIKNIRVYKLLIVIVFIILLVVLAAGQSPQRSENQRLFDDFVTIVSKASTSTEEVKPQAKVEFNVAGKQYFSNLDWQDRALAARTIRILELLKAANIFSDSREYPNDAGLNIKVTGPSGYEFNSSIELAEVKADSPLALALVLMKESD